MKIRIIVCVLATSVLLGSGDGDVFVNNFQASPKGGKSELNYSPNVYQGAFQDGVENTNPDYQQAPAGTYLDPNNTSGSGLNDGEIAGIALGGAAALGGIGAGSTLIAKRWRRAIDASIKRRREEKASGGLVLGASPVLLPSSPSETSPSTPVTALPTPSTTGAGGYGDPSTSGDVPVGGSVGVDLTKKTALPVSSRETTLGKSGVLKPVRNRGGFSRQRRHLK